MGEYQPTAWAQFSAINRAYLLDVDDQYRSQPESVDPEMRALFQRLGPPPDALPEPPAARAAAGMPASMMQAAGAMALANSIRSHGHRGARLDPLGSEPVGDADLLPET